MIDEHEPGNGIYTYGAIRDTLDAVGVPASGTISERILWLHRRAEAEAKEAAENLAKCERERDDFDATWQDAKERLDRARVELSDATAEIGFLKRELAETRALADRRAAETREVLHREREERATEKATLGAALHTLRAETETLGETVDRLHEENERLAAQLEFAERVLITGIRRVVP